MDRLTVVCDQIGTPTYTYDWAWLLVDMIETEKYGYYHATNEGGYISWYDFTKEIFRQAIEQGQFGICQSRGKTGDNRRVRRFQSKTSLQLQTGQE